jgi:glutathione S-transferase
MPIVHGVNGSPFVRKVRVALAEKGIAYTLDPVIPMGVSEEFKKKSPLGKIPVWEDESGYVLPDSSCILAYLERIHPTPALQPSDPKEYGRSLFYEEYADTRLMEAISPVFFERYVRKNLFKQEPDEARVQKALTELIPPAFDYLEAQIGNRPWLVGSRFSTADIAVGSFFVNLMHGGECVDAARWPNLAAYVERVHSRPSFKALIEEERGNVPRA